MSPVALEHSRTYFEEFVAWAPDPFKGLARTITDVPAWLLELVSGDPDQLTDAAGECAAIGDALWQISDDFGTHVTTVRASWDDDAARGFEANMSEFRSSMRDLADGFDDLKEILIAAAEAAVAVFNLILEIILELILWLVTEWVLALAASIISAGVSVVAAGVSSMARLATALSRIGRIIAQLAEFLLKLRQQLRRFADFLKLYSKTMRDLKRAKKTYAVFAKARYTRDGMDFLTGYYKWVAPGKLLFNKASPIALSGGAGTGLDAGMGIYDVSDGTKDRNYLAKDTYHDITGEYTTYLQSLVDAVE